MSAMFGAPKAPTAAPPPQIDEARSRLIEADKAAQRNSRRRSVLTGDNGLPDLGTVSRPQE